MTSGIIEVAQSDVSGPIEAVVDSFVVELLFYNAMGTFSDNI